MEEVTEPNLEVRVGALLSLERIAEDSARDRDRILRILCAYLRGNSRHREVPDSPRPRKHPAHTAQQKVEDWHHWRYQVTGHYASHIQRPRVDIETAFFVLRDSFSSTDVFMDADLMGIYLRATKISGANLAGTHLDSSDFSGASLHQFNLSGAKLFRANFQGANLSDVSFKDAAMQFVDLSASEMTFVDLDQTKLTFGKLNASIISGCSMNSADLLHATLAAAKLFRCDLSTAHLSKAILEGTRFQQCQFDGALWDAPKFNSETGFPDCTMKGAAVLNCDFRDLPQLAPFLSDLFGDASSVPPDGSAPEDPGWPAHWSRRTLSPEAFDRAWRDWTRASHPGVRRLSLKSP
ncbi:pentapeptide repeat-containing protein [Pseudooceanicola sp. CBS1P-1]|uniref:Pentapeptide repeat-containing protein n=1 Tax=Pseudooceanicola albus TaxID=2692189 RepID=A0A6L7FXJ4_9RHOB|nr:MULTISPECIES: pentapeptide repeat-containing protein [Pseudooceanicola]MBT9382281.1 pentapeptide repeat-containing protein [Pseudooceanicola endophyticus]MXN16824.1 hypothetical protein [Pseudooceanicola albus]